MVTSLVFFLMHPLTQFAWMGLNSPMVTDNVGGMMEGGLRRLKEVDVGDHLRRLQTTSSSKTVCSTQPDGSYTCKTENADVSGPVLIAVIASVAAAIIVPIVIWVVYAFMYKSKVTDQRPALPQPVEGDYKMSSGQFKNGLCSCCDDTQYCLNGCCCMDVTAADAFQTAGSGTFWGTMWIFVGTWILYEIVNLGLAILFIQLEMGEQGQRVGNIAWFIAAIPLAACFAKKRAGVRRSLGDPNPDGQCFMDFVMYWFCTPCSVIQDARQLDGASSVRVECCCNLVRVQSMPPMAVGAPVVVAGTAVPEQNK